MKRKFLILICLILFFVSVAGVSATEDVNQTIIEDTNNIVSNVDTLSVSEAEDVNQTIDDDALSVSDDIDVISAKDDGTFTALQKKIDDAREGSTITLENDYIYNNDFGTVYGIEISKPLTIDGNNHIIDALSDSRIFSIESDNVVLKNIKFDNGYSYYVGGAIYMEGENCSVINSTFTNNIGRNGAAIYFTGSNCNIINSTFIKNTAVPSFQGDQIGNSYYTYYVGGYGGAIYLKGDGCSVINSIFTDNRANRTSFENPWGSGYMNAGGYGGAIYVEGNKDNLSFSIFKNNIAADRSSGGAIYLEGDDSVINYCSYSKENSNIDGIYISGNNNVINEFSTTINVEDVTKDYGGPEKLEITLTESDKPIPNADVNINIDDKNYTKTTDANGKTSLELNFNAGNYDATVTYGDISTVAKVTINQLTTTNTLTYDKKSHNSVNLIATVNPSTAGGNVVFTVNGKDYAADKVSDGKATRTLSNLAVGNYEAKATYEGDINYKSSSSDNVKFTVEEYSIIVSAPDVTKYYGGDERFVVTVTDNAGKPVANEPVKVTINGQKYDRKTGDDGRTTFAINLRSGTHEATTEHDGEIIKSTITVKTTVISKNVTKIFRNGTNYEASFLDKKGNKAPAGGKVSININGVFYQRTIKDDGSISFALNLEQGTYVLTLTNPYTGEEISNTVKILPNIVENKDLTKYYRNGSQFTFKLLDDKGNPVAGQKASININGVFYTRTTNDKGIATFQINLEPGTYVLTLEYKGCRVSNTVTVLSVIKSSDIKMKYQDGTRFKVTILDGVGKPYANQSVTFNINGVFYYRTTKDDGSTSLAINLMAGEYIITTTYNSLNVSNKVTIAG